MHWRVDLGVFKQIDISQTTGENSKLANSKIRNIFEIYSRICWIFVKKKCAIIRRNSAQRIQICELNFVAFVFWTIPLKPWKMLSKINDNLSSWHLQTFCKVNILKRYSHEANVITVCLCVCVLLKIYFWFSKSRIYLSNKMSHNFYLCRFIHLQ